MKIVVDFVRAGQEWDPTTGEQSNYVVFAFAGKEMTFPVDETTLVAMIQQSKNGTAVSAHVGPGSFHDQAATEDPDAYHGPTDDEFLVDLGEPTSSPDETEVVYSGQDEVFGGDVEPVAPPTLFDTDHLEEPEPPHREPTDVTKRMKQLQDKRKQVAPAMQARKERLAALREKAKKVPMVRVRKDEMGYPEKADVAALSAQMGGPRQTPRFAHGAPEVEQRNISAPDLDDGDEDGFEQG